MASEFHKKAISRITPEERALMVKSLEIISQIHAILDSRDISQKKLAEMLKVSPAAVSKMLSPSRNLELNSIIRLEMLLGETILTTPQSISVPDDHKIKRLKTSTYQSDGSHLKVAYRAAEETYAQIAVS